MEQDKIFSCVILAMYLSGHVKSTNHLPTLAYALTYLHVLKWTFQNIIYSSSCFAIVIFPFDYLHALFRTRLFSSCVVFTFLAMEEIDHSQGIVQNVTNVPHYRFTTLQCSTLSSLFLNMLHHAKLWNEKPFALSTFWYQWCFMSHAWKLYVQGLWVH